MDKDLFAFYKSALSGEMSTPLCGEYKSAWRKCGDDVGKLVSLAMCQQSLPFVIAYCYGGKGLEKEYILKTFREYINNNSDKSVIRDADGVSGYTYSLYVAFDNVLKADADVVAFMWCNCPMLTIKSTKSPVLYIGAGSCVHIVCEGYNCPKVYLFDDSKVVLDDVCENSTVTIYSYSENAQVEFGKYCIGNVKQFNKKLRL